MPQIEVTFDIDANGIVNVSAKDKGTGKEQKMTITSSSGLSKDEVDRMMREAEAHAEEDRKRRAVTDARNQADGLIYQIEKTLSENKDKVPAADVSRIESAVASLKKALEGDDEAAIRAEMETLQKASHAMAEALYKQAPGAPADAAPDAGQAPPGGGPGQGGRGTSGDVIDAEVVDDDKK